MEEGHPCAPRQPLVSVVAVVVIVGAAFVGGLPVSLAQTPAAPLTFELLLKGAPTTFPAADLTALERSIGGSVGAAAQLVLRVGNAVGAECTAAPVDLPSQVAVAQRLLAIALVEAVRGRSGAAIALSTAADLAVAVAACPPQTNEGAQAAAAIALITVTTATYLVAHGGLDLADVRGVARRLRPFLGEGVDVLLLPIPARGPLIEGTSTVHCRRRGDLSVLSEQEAATVAALFEASVRSVFDLPVVPTLNAITGQKGAAIGLRLKLGTRPTDDFLRSCGLADGDVLVSINGKSVSSPEQLLHIDKVIAADRRAVVAVLRSGTELTIIVDEDHGP